MALIDELANFQSQLDAYQKHLGYIERAKSQSSKFSAAVIEKVILDHSLKCAETADLILPLVPQLESALAAIGAKQRQVDEGKSDAAEKMEELELRQAIGEIDDDEFNLLGESLRETLDSAASQLSALADEAAEITGKLDRWSTLARDSGQADGRSSGRASAGTPSKEEPAEEDPAEDEQSAADESEEGSFDEPTGMSAAQDLESDAVADDAVVYKGLREDLSEVLSSPSQDITVDEEIVAAIEASDVVEDAEMGADVDIGFDDEGAGQDLLRRGEGGEVDLDLSDDVESPMPADEIAVSMDVEVAGDEGDEAAEEPRRALLLYQEGTAEEQIYPFTSDVLTVGRGRDNDIQIKNDSKVSRFHCKLYRKGNQFFIEDNKSSNGSLVNGELITERRLFGGEEVIIGETFFRFRIL